MFYGIARAEGKIALLKNDLFLFVIRLKRNILLEAEVPGASHGIANLLVE